MATLRIAGYYHRHSRTIWIMACSIQIITFTLMGYTLSRYTTLSPALYWAMFASIALVHTMLLYVVLRLAMEPIGYLGRAIALVSKQISDVTPPNLSGTRHERSGLKMMLQTIYDLSLNSTKLGDDGARKSNRLASKLIDNLPAGVIALDSSGAIIYANQNAPVRSTGRGRKSLELVFDENDSLDQWLEHCQTSAVSEKRQWSKVQNVLPGNDNRKLYDISAHYQKDGDGGIETIIVTLDRSERYAPDEEDMDFIALAAHELRGPITVIRGYLDVLDEEIGTLISPDQKNLLDRLNVSSNRLSGYINNILNVARYDRRHLKLHLAEDSITAIYDTVADDLQLRARTQNRLLDVQIPSDLPTIAVDRNSITEVIANLVDNAIKYSNEGGIVKVSAEVDGDMVAMHVQDHGIGIPSSVVGHLFTKFYRSHRSRQTIAGTGLGLYISRGIIESHGGNIGVKSTEGHGSTFSFTVPIYATVRDKLLTSGSTNQDIIESSNGWIKNHNMYRT